jgi:plasmid maintenance system antidote protein VapI
MIEPVHPSEVFLEEFLPPARLGNGLERGMEILIEFLKKKDVDESLSKKLSIYTGTTPAFWLNLQEKYDDSVNNS